MSRLTRDGDAGSATVWFVSMVAILGAATLVLAHVGTALVERLEARSAADLAALAGAEALQRGADGCASAAAIAAANRAELVGCVATGLEIRVRARVVVALPLLGPLPVTVRARAGPATHAGPPLPVRPATWPGWATR